MSKEVDCELFRRGVALAKAKGLPAKEIVCANDNVCDGSFCMLIPETLVPGEYDSQRPTRVEIFNARLERTIRGR